MVSQDTDAISFKYSYSDGSQVGPWYNENSRQKKLCMEKESYTAVIGCHTRDTAPVYSLVTLFGNKNAV